MTDDIFYFEDENNKYGDIPSSFTLTGGDSIGLTSSSLLSTKPLLFDVSWEVCRKVGGIYTVIASKALVTVKEWGDRYALVGPFSDVSFREFEEVPPSKLVSTLIDQMQKKYGIKVYFGRWLVKGYPKAFLLDPSSSFSKIAEWRNDLMGNFQVPDDMETNDAIVFGNQVALFFQEFRAVFENRPIVAHFHEWLAAVGLIKLKQMNVQIATIFTTHATLLGRWMASGDLDLYNIIQSTNPDEEAGKRLIYHKHWIEVGAARGSDIFTTVSDITGYEAEHLLGRKPDIITPNGLNVERFVALHEFQNLHKKYKDTISEFIRGHFYGHLDFDLDKTLYIFTAGRREYRNKGLDLYIEALAELNHLLKEENSQMTIVAFIITPGKTNNYNVESIKGQSVRREIRTTCNKIVKRINERLYEALIQGEVPDAKSLLTQEDIITLKKRTQMVQQNRPLPPIVTHNMIDGDNDEILNHLKRCNLINKPEDRVKIIYHPEFLKETSPIFPIDYSEFVRGCHMGVFPSYYEPWGYTPAECLVMGVPSVSSNLTGFANFISERVPKPSDNGIYIIDRRFQGFQESKHQLANILWKFSHLTRRERIELRNKTERLSHILDWKELGKLYYKARKMALKKVYGINIPQPSVFKESDEFIEYNETDYDDF